jgi:hypothetical protein
VLTINARDPSINLDNLWSVIIGGMFRVGCQMLKVNEVMSSGLIMALCVFLASRRGDIYGPTPISNTQKIIHFVIK